MVGRMTVYGVAKLFNVLFDTGSKLDIRINVSCICNQPLVIFSLFINVSVCYII